MDATFELMAHEESEIRQVYHIILPRKAYYSSQGSRVSVAPA